MGGRGKNLKNSLTIDNIPEDIPTIKITHNRTDSEYHNNLAKSAERIATELGIDGELSIEFVDDYSVNPGAEGWVKQVEIEDGFAMDGSKMFIFVKRESFNNHESVMTHELTHIKQARDKRFKIFAVYGSRDNGVYFDGKLVYSLSEYKETLTNLNSSSYFVREAAREKYEQFPWEVEAFKAQEVYWDKFHAAKAKNK